MSGRIVFRILGGLLILALLIAGGSFIFQAGVAQGISQAPEVATAIEQAAENGQSMPMMHNYHYGYGHHGFGYGHHFGFGIFKLIGFLFFMFIFFGVMRMIFFRAWGHKHGGHWGGKWENKFDEWHKHAHGENTESKSENA
jgi:hypothetical protein